MFSMKLKLSHAARRTSIEPERLDVNETLCGFGLWLRGFRVDEEGAWWTSSVLDVCGESVRRGVSMVRGGLRTDCFHCLRHTDVDDLLGEWQSDSRSDDKKNIYRSKLHVIMF
jgi:hypothetical protein